MHPEHLADVPLGDVVLGCDPHVPPQRPPHGVEHGYHAKGHPDGGGPVQRCRELNPQGQVQGPFADAVEEPKDDCGRGERAARRTEHSLPARRAPWRVSAEVRPRTRVPRIRASTFP